MAKVIRALSVAGQVALFLVLLSCMLYFGQGCATQKVGPSLKQSAAEITSTDAAFGQSTADGKETSDQRGVGTVTALEFGKDGRTSVKTTGAAMAVVSIPGIGQVMSGRDFKGSADKIYQPGPRLEDGTAGPPVLLAEGVVIEGTASTATTALNTQVAAFAAMVQALAPDQRAVAEKELETISATATGVTKSIVDGVIALINPAAGAGGILAPPR